MDVSLIAAHWPLVAGLLLSGVLAGLIAGLLGVGGGIVMVPAMAMTFQALNFDSALTQHVSVGTSLAAIVVTGYVSARAHQRRGAVNLDILKLWGPVIFAAALLGGLMARLYSGMALRLIFGIVALFIALNIVLPIQKKLMARLAGSRIAHRISAGLIGYISALMGIGGGSLSVPTLVAFGTPMHQAVGTSAALGVLIALPGALGFLVSGWGLAGLPPLSIGFINLPALALIAGTASLVAPFGAAIAHRLNATALKAVFALFLLTVSAKMIWQAIAG